jgi:outer membrane lipoprotein carrier protein
MKKLLAVLLLLITGFTYAQDQDPKAKAILDDLSKTTKAYKTIVAEYTLTVLNKDKKQTDKQTGKIHVKGNKFRLEIPGNDIASDGKTVITHNKDAKECTIKDFEPSKDDGIDPTKIFTLYETGYKYKYSKEEKINGVTMHVIDLFPSVKPEKKKFHTIKLYVDKTKKQVAMIKMMMKDGGMQTYELKNFKPNQELADALFTIDTKKCGCEVIDERS